MADDNPPTDQPARADRRAYRDPHGSPPLPDGDRVQPSTPTTPPPSATTRHQLIAALILMIIVAAIVLRALR
ncbi:hypothetical protein [Salinispora oceanensis]|uniref:hypothetical protein n=1 Tax=Salinispora oceanensis TaxID=1050199 RepID=UPI0003802896|nr:hypothetical protein [Salinispora oceanensis]